jgi:lysozyme family protein
MGDFDKAFDLLMINEGGFVHDPDDPGGRTNYGITEGFLRAIGDHRDPAELSKEEAREIYRVHFWRRVKADELPEPLATMVFDAAVNHGVGGATKMMQELCNAYLGSGLKVDGAFGPRTLAAVNELWQAYGMQAVGMLLERRRRLYDGHKAFWKFGRGWYNRLRQCARFAAEQIDEAGVAA